MAEYHFPIPGSPDEGKIIAFIRVVRALSSQGAKD
jgi:hypothetical protein